MAEPNTIDTVVVTATRTAEPAKEALEPVVIIDRSTLENSLATDVGDVLRFYAGLDIGRSGGPGQPVSLFIRGANSNQSIVMIDGVRINPGTIGGAPLQNLAPELFDRIEIIKGPRSAIYGTDAVGGVVNLLTRQGGPSGTDLMVSYGRYNTGEVALDAHYTQGDTSFGAVFTGQQSSGFPSFAADTLDRGYKNLSGTAFANTKLGPVEVGALYWIATGTSHYAEANYNEDFTAFSSFSPRDEYFHNSALALHASGDITDIWHARATVSRVLDDVRQKQTDDFTDPLVGDFDYTSRDTLDIQNDVRLSGPVSQLLTFGAILMSEQTESLSFGTPYSVGTHTNTFYLQDQLKLGRSHLLLAGGYYHHPAFGNHETWNAEYGFDMTSNVLLIASAGTAFRAPSATDRFGYGGTPDLKPESAHNYEVGVKASIGANQQITIAAFQNTITDLIEFVFDPTNTIYFGENRNLQRARIRGLEATWELHADLWSLRAEASLQNSQNLSDDATDSQLLRRTKHSFTVSAARQIGRGEVGIDLLNAGARRDIDVVSGAFANDGGYLLAGVRGKFVITPAWSVSARLDNATNHRYQLANGYNTAARSASISTRYQFH